MTDRALTASRVWKRMAPEQRMRAAAALWADRDASGDQAQAVQLIAKHLKFRVKTVNGLDKDRKARYLAAVPDVPDLVAARLLAVYHLAEQRAMMAAFLDALGISHDRGLIQDDAAMPDPAKLADAAAAIRSRFPAPDVALYLDTLLVQDPATWGALGELREPA